MPPTIKKVETLVMHIIKYLCGERRKMPSAAHSPFYYARATADLHKKAKGAQCDIY
jgi:hypothetical protein